MALAAVKVLENIHRLNQLPRFAICHVQKTNFSATRKLHNDKSTEKLYNDEPIKYSATKAAKMPSSLTFLTESNSAVLPIERYVVMATLMVFLIYVAFLRKENKIDEIINGTFRYEGDEELKLVHALIKAKMNGLKTDEIEKKLKELRAQS